MTDPAGGGPGESQVADLADVPIGTVTTYAGDCGDTGVIAHLGSLGWMLCDGSSLLIDEYPKLYNVIRLNFGGEYSPGNPVPVKFQLPDLSGQFVRGVNLTAIDQATGQTVDPDAATRVASAQNGNAGNHVGSLQLAATGLPATPLRTDGQGGHHHQAAHLTHKGELAFDSRDISQAKNNTSSVSLPSGGEHKHQVTGGGDTETRPVSLSLFFIIKAF
jgi:microcystin-dependent protein